MINHHINFVRIKSVANAFNKLNEKVVFVGGATVSLYPDMPVSEVRPTDDIDVIVEILNFNDRVELENRLREIGFENDIESGIICRYKINGIIVDIMPTNDISIGFTNIWYQDGFQNAIEYTLENVKIRILTASYFIATKLEAFKGRGNNDGRFSTDFEDIIHVLENRSTVWLEIQSAPKDLKNYLQIEFQTLLENKNLPEWIDCHIERGISPSTLKIINQMKQFVSFDQ